MNQTESTQRPDQLSTPTLSPPPSRIPSMLMKEAVPTTAVQSAQASSVLPVVAAQPQSTVAEALRFPQKLSDVSISLAVQTPVHQHNERTCVLPKGLVFTGEAHYPCDVRIDGVVEGKMTAEPDRTITVEREGKFKGSMRATNVNIEGEVDGDITASGGLASFGQKSVCKGHITYGGLKIAEGADVEATMKKLKA